MPYNFKNKKDMQRTVAAVRAVESMGPTLGGDGAPRYAHDDDPIFIENNSGATIPGQGAVLKIETHDDAGPWYNAAKPDSDEIAVVAFALHEISNTDTGWAEFPSGDIEAAVEASGLSALDTIGPESGSWVLAASDTGTFVYLEEALDQPDWLTGTQVLAKIRPSTVAAAAGEDGIYTPLPPSFADPDVEFGGDDTAEHTGNGHVVHVPMDNPSGGFNYSFGDGFDLSNDLPINTTYWNSDGSQTTPWIHDGLGRVVVMPAGTARAARAVHKTALGSVDCWAQLQECHVSYDVASTPHIDLWLRMATSSATIQDGYYVRVDTTTVSDVFTLTIYKRVSGGVTQLATTTSQAAGNFDLFFSVVGSTLTAKALLRFASIGGNGNYSRYITLTTTDSAITTGVYTGMAGKSDSHASGENEYGAAVGTFAAGLATRIPAQWDTTFESVDDLSEDAEDDGDTSLNDTYWTTGGVVVNTDGSAGVEFWDGDEVGYAVSKTSTGSRNHWCMLHNVKLGLPTYGDGYARTVWVEMWLRRYDASAPLTSEGTLDGNGLRLRIYHEVLTGSAGDGYYEITQHAYGRVTILRQGQVSVGASGDYRVYYFGVYGNTVVALGGTMNVMAHVEQIDTGRYVAWGMRHQGDPTGTLEVGNFVAGNTLTIPFAYQDRGTDDTDGYTAVWARTDSAAAAEITVDFGGTNVPDGDTTPTVAKGTDFGSVWQGQSEVHDFTLSNIGTMALALRDATITPGTGWTVDAQPGSPVLDGNDTTLSIGVDSTNLGTFDSTVSFENTDSDESPYTFDITVEVIADPREDLSAYDKTDPGPAFTISPVATVTVAGLARNVDAHLSDDKGSGNFGATFTIDWEFSQASSGDQTSQIWACCVSNVIEDAAYWSANNSEAIGTRIYRLSSSPRVRIRLQEFEGNTSDTYDATNEDTLHYITTERTGSTAIEDQIYSDEARTSSLDTLSVTIATTTFQYFVAVVSFNSGDAAAWDGVIANFLLG